MQDLLDTLCSRQGPSPAPEAEATDRKPVVSRGGGAWSVQAPQQGGFRAASCPEGTPTQPRGARGWTVARQSGSAAGGLFLALRGQHPLFLGETSGPPSPCTGCRYDLQCPLRNLRERSHWSPRGGRADKGTQRRDTDSTGQEPLDPATPEARLPSPTLGSTLHSEVLTNPQLDLLALPGAAFVTLGQSFPSLSVTGL